jgi:hypothetical protein
MGYGPCKRDHKFFSPGAAKNRPFIIYTTRKDFGTHGPTHRTTILAGIATAQICAEKSIFLMENPE